MKQKSNACIYQIDQSGKIEQTERNTVVACINGQEVTVLLKSGEKRKLQRVFKTASMQRLFPILTFAALVAILLHKLQSKGKVVKVVIDREYFGHETFIEDRMIIFITQLGSKIPQISFGHVGKLSKAHQSGYRVAIGKEKATLTVNSDEVLRIIFGTKNRANTA